MKQNKKSCILSALLLGLAILCLCPASVRAAIRQKAQTKNTITITWDDPYADSANYKVTGYELRYIKYADSQNIDSRKAVKLDASRTSYTIKNLKPGTKYMVKIQYYYSYTSSYDGTVKQYGPTNIIKYDLFTLPGKVTGVNQVRWWHYAKSVNFGWNKQDACKYQWRVTKNNGKAFGSGKDSSYPQGSVTKISNTMTYKLKVRAYIEDKTKGKTYYGDWSDTAYLFDQPMVKDAKVATSFS